MSTHVFSYKQLDELKTDIQKKGLCIPITEDMSSLRGAIRIHGKEVPNALCIHPMEGQDAKNNGSPGDLTYRRYQRFASGGAGMIWVESTALTLEGTGFSWLRQFFPHVGAAMVKKGWMSFLGVGRVALAHPDFANNLLRHGCLKPQGLCRTCSRCTQIGRYGGYVGCVTHDSEIYRPIYQAARRAHAEPNKHRQ